MPNSAKISKSFIDNDFDYFVYFLLLEKLSYRIIELLYRIIFSLESLVFKPVILGKIKTGCPRTQVEVKVEVE
jgi:hypothetical protein